VNNDDSDYSISKLISFQLSFFPDRLKLLFFIFLIRLCAYYTQHVVWQLFSSWYLL